MIVTCPGCGSKYRVRDEAVPAGGAELKCPSCQAVFVAHPPKHSEEEVATAVDRLTKAKEAAEQRTAALEGEKHELQTRLSDIQRRAAESEGRAKLLEAQVSTLSFDLQRAHSD